MRFLRMLTNSLLAGALGAAFLTIVVLQLNPNVPLASETTWRLFVAFGLFYGVHLAVLFYLLMVARELVGFRAISPGWVSVRVLAWLTAASAAVAAVLMWLNVGGLSAALGETAVRRMTAGAAATTATAIVLLGLAAAHYSFGRRGSRVGAALLAIAVFGSLALPVAARGPGVPANERIGVGGHRRRAAAGLGSARRDAAARRRVARIHLAARGRRTPPELRAAPREQARRWTWPPCGRRGPDPVWAAVATGMYPGEERRALAVRVLRARRYAADRAPAGLLLLARAGPPRVSAPRAELVRFAARAAALEHPRRRGHHGRRRALAADISGAAGARVRAERPFPPASRIVPGARRQRRVSVERVAGGPQRVCRARRGARMAALAGVRR